MTNKSEYHLTYVNNLHMTILCELYVVIIIHGREHTHENPNYPWKGIISPIQDTIEAYYLQIEAIMKR